MRATMLKTWRILQATYAEWQADRVPRLGAALAYYFVFSIAPLLVIAVAVASLVLDELTVREQLRSQLRSYVGDAGSMVIQELIQNAQSSGSGVWVTLVSFAGLLFAATGSVIALKDALNTIWGVVEVQSRAWWCTVLDRLRSLLLVITVGILLLTSVILTTVLTAMSEFVTEYVPLTFLPLARLIDLLVSFLVVTLLAAAIFKWLPNVRLRWRDVWIGAAVTSVHFLVGKELIGAYLGRASVKSTFGAAGSLAIVLLWAYYSSQILLLGAEFTQVYARQRRVRVEPDELGMRVSDGKRGKQSVKSTEKRARSREVAKALARRANGNYKNRQSVKQSKSRQHVAERQSPDTSQRARRRRRIS